MTRATGACAVTFLTMFVVPLPFYAAFEALGLAGLPQGGSPGEFILSVVVMKIGVAIGFVLIYQRTIPSWTGRLWTYAGIWWLMYAIVEIGQAVGPGYGAGDAAAGILAEGVYFPVSAWLVARMLQRA